MGGDWFATKDGVFEVEVHLGDDTIITVKREHLEPKEQVYATEIGLEDLWDAYCDPKPWWTGNPVVKDFSLVHGTER